MAITDNITLYFKLDTDGTITDATGNGYSGTINGATYTASGKINGCYSFDGTNDSIVTTLSGDIADGQAFSISLWVYPTTTGTVTKRIFDNTGDGGSNGNEQVSIFTYDGNMNLKIKDDGSKNFTLSTSYSTNTWYHVVVTFDGTDSWKLYVNNSLEDSDTQATTDILPGEDYTIGARAESLAENFEGKIDEIGIWTKELTSTEVTTLYNSGNGLQYPFTTSSGLNIKINIGDTWKDVSAMKININDTWKEVAAIKQNIGDSWKNV